MSAYDPDPAARLLVQAWREGKQLQELPAEARPASLDQGYDLQDRFIESLGGAAGWKLGVGSPANLRAFKLERPLAGRVVASRQFRSGDTVTLRGAAPVTLEFEIAFVFGRDIAPGERLADPMDAVAAVHSTFELVQSRFVNRRGVGWPSFAGDSVGFEALVIGEPFERARIHDVAPDVVISADGAEAARGLAGDDLTDPVRALSYLIDHARDRKATLKRGEIATLGAIGKPFDLARDAEVVARYLGRELRFTMRMPR
jgi:2-keto-4-pentenoate hydratase